MADGFCIFSRWFLYFQQMVSVFSADDFCISSRWFLCFHDAVFVSREQHALHPLALVFVSVRVLCAVAHTQRTHHNRSCPVFGNNFNTLTALFAHQPPTSPQKIDSREGWFWCKKGLVLNATKMYFYLNTPQFAPVFGPFAAKCSKTQNDKHKNTLQSYKHNLLEPQETRLEWAK